MHATALASMSIWFGLFFIVGIEDSVNTLGWLMAIAILSALKAFEFVL